MELCNCVLGRVTRFESFCPLWYKWFLRNSPVPTAAAHGCSALTKVTIPLTISVPTTLAPDTVVHYPWTYWTGNRCLRPTDRDSIARNRFGLKSRAQPRRVRSASFDRYMSGFLRSNTVCKRLVRLTWSKWKTVLIIRVEQRYRAPRFFIDMNYIIMRNSNDYVCFTYTGMLTYYITLFFLGRVVVRVRLYLYINWWDPSYTQILLPPL